MRPVTPEESTFRHSGWADRRKKVFDSLTRLHVSSKRLESFCNCGSGLWLQVSEAHDDLKLSCNCCHDRFCIPCQTTRAAFLRENITKAMTGKCPRFLTFTLRHSKTELASQIQRLYRSFTVLRRRQSWKSHVTGGAAFCEVKLSDRDGLWHVHLHCLVEGTWWSQKEISQEWLEVTGDSSIVDIRQVNDSEHVAAYVTKYVTKPADSSVFAVPDKLDELIISLKGRRLCLTFGSWRGIKLEARPPETVKWVTIDSFDGLASRAAAGDPDAQRWVEAAIRKWPGLGNWLTTVPPPPE